VRGFFRVAGWTAAVALIVVIALYAVMIVYLRHKQNPPDVTGIARSQPIVNADHVAASATSAALKALAPAGASWLASGPTAVSDLCVSVQDGEFISSWTPVTCMRTVTAYFFFNGSFQQHMRAWDAALRATGWSPTGYPLSLPLSYYAEFGHRPEPHEPGQRYLATSLPPSGSYDYIRPFEGSSAPGRAVSLVFRWAERPQMTPSLENTDQSPVPGPDTAVAWIQKATVSPDAVESAAFTRYQFVAIATLTAGYYDSAAPAQGPTTNSAPAVGHCMSGSGTCN
jgi:hypothetical protein